MSGRKLGGGRVLGSGKSLAPPTPAHQRNGGVISPSESTLSSSNSASPLATLPLPDSAQDLISKVSLNHGGSSAPVGNKLLCPICEEEMVSALRAWFRRG